MNLAVQSSLQYRISTITKEQNARKTAATNELKIGGESAQYQLNKMR